MSFSPLDTNVIIRFLTEKPVVVACLEILQQRKLDLVDAYLLAWTEQNGIDSAYSFDSDLSKNGLHLLPVV